MKVLLTRPAGKNADLARALDQRQVPYLIEPLLVVEPLSPTEGQLAALTSADILIFISTNAVEFAAPHLHQRWPGAQYYAVGDATAEALSRLAIDCERAPVDSQATEGLLRLPSLSHPAGKQVWIIRGQGGREALAESLIARGADVHYLEVYRRACPALDGAACIQHWQNFGVDTIVVTSGEVLDNLLNLVPKDSFAWLCGCHIIVPSARVEAHAKKQGLTRVTNAGAANQQAVLDALAM